MASSFRVVLDRKAVNALLLPGGLVDQAVERAASRTAYRAKRNITIGGRVRTGKMRRSVDYERDGRSSFVVFAAAPYSHYQEEGVKGPIYPVNAKALRFKPKGSSKFVFAASTSGFPGIHFMRRAIDQLTVQDFSP